MKKVNKQKEKKIEIETDFGSVNIDTGNKYLDIFVFIVVVAVVATFIYGYFL